MSYGHAGELAGHGHSGRSDAAPRIDPALLVAPRMLAALAVRDITTVYRRLREGGVTQRTIAQLTGQSQSEVCEIIQGRKVGMYDVLVRICDGLGVPREAMGLSYGERSAYAEDYHGRRPPERVDNAMRRRVLLAAAGVAVAGHPVRQLGELLELPGPSPVSLPSRLDWVHVAKLRDLTRRLGEAAHGRICDPDVCSAAAARAARLLDVSGAEPVKRALLTAVAELHLEAGRAARDADLYDRFLHHCTRALQVATEAGDVYLQALALNQAGKATLEHGHPNDALKMLQLGQVKAWDIPRDDRRMVVVGESGRAALEACALADSATALTALGRSDIAAAKLAKSRELWQPTREDPFGDPDRVAACLEADRGRLEVAEQLAAASVRRWDGINPGARTRSGIVLATVHVRAGEPRGLTMAKTAIDAVAQLNSPRTRRQLTPLVDALDARRGSDAGELAGMARKVAATAA